MRISPISMPVARGLAVQLSQPPGAITDDAVTRRASRHTFDIRA